MDLGGMMAIGLTVRLVQLDGSLPNLALMKLAHWHKELGDAVHFSRSVQPTLFEPSRYSTVYGSAIFTKSAPAIAELRTAFPGAIVGGTGYTTLLTVEDLIGVDSYEHYDYGIYPGYPWSIGFTQRGCRLNCGFCVVPQKEGRPSVVNSIADIWRPETPRNVVLLDNDFFGQPADDWRARVDELNGGGFRVNFNQGVNVRLLKEDSAAALASLQYYDRNFKHRRLYTAWDNLGQEGIFFRGLEMLTEAGIPPAHVMVYMLVGYRPGETMDEVMYRFQRLKDAGCLPYPMVYEDDGPKPQLKAFQRWVVRRYHQFVSRWRGLLLVIRAKLEAVDTGITTLETEFLANVVLSDGRMLGEWIVPQLEKAASNNQMPPALMAGRE